MKKVIITTPNDKWQIVIPKYMRDALDIQRNALISLSLAGKGMYMYPVEEFLTKADTESSYMQLLEKTKGAWRDDDWETREKKKKNIELAASKVRKKVW